MRHKSWLLYLFVLIISVATLIPLFTHTYFSMHDDQHIARLYLLDKGINQGILYPRWVDTLGFGYGYPLFNFYPPLIYYVAEFFVSIGFGYITAIKLMLLIGTCVGTFGVFQLMRKLYGPAAALFASILFNFFSYRAITLYIRGAFAEFFALSLVPWALFSLYRLRSTSHMHSLIFAAIIICFIILSHPFVAIPAAFFLSVFVLLQLFSMPTNQRGEYFKNVSLSGILGLALSAFFWLPSMVERGYTLVDTILLKELASYTIHFVYPQQLWYSPWGFGGSVEGLGDGLSFQINKLYILCFIASMLIMSLTVLQNKKDETKKLTLINVFTVFFFVMLVVSIFMMIPQSKPIWDNVVFLQYLQFPWRFMAFVGLFITLFCGAGIYYLQNILNLHHINSQKIILGIILITALIFYGVQGKYFKPQQYISTSNAERTEYKEIAWRISKTSFEFVPKGVRTKQTSYNTTTLAIDEDNIVNKPFSIMDGTATVETLAHQYNYKKFSIHASSPFIFRLHTYYFPGWKAYIDGVETKIHDKNDFRLIEIGVPRDAHIVEFKFIQTPVRSIGAILSMASWVFVFSSLYLSIGKPRSIQGK